MYHIDVLIEQALGCGFSRAAELRVKDLEFMPAVREMCAENRCNRYGKCWVCPPGCGALEEIEQKVLKYECGVLVQTIGLLEDDFDYPAMKDTEKKHEEHFACLREKLKTGYPHMLPIGAGSCSICEQCTYPDAPCRFPERAFPSMEAYGLLVSRVCELSGLPYYSGPQTVTYTSCFLLE